eukprot:scaffold8481_cov33-Attheya_sp.AAC.4
MVPPWWRHRPGRLLCVGGVASLGVASRVLSVCLWVYRARYIPSTRLSSVADRETIFRVRNSHGCAGSIAIWLWGNVCAPHYH